MQTLTLDDLPECLVGFPASRIQGAQVAWFNKPLLDSRFASLHGDWTEEDFAARFAYAMPGSECFEALEFDSAATQEFQAERYGGPGVGGNGGGARVGNCGAFQIKGMGKNLLAAADGEHWHTYGALSLPDAVTEVVNSLLLNRLAPLGANDIYGLILTGPACAYWLPKGQEGALGWGALLVRERCLRYAHFMRAPGFQPSDAPSPAFLPDLDRVRAVNRRLMAHLGGHKGLMRQLSDFLAGCASQFAFAKVHRLMHGVLSPSNMDVAGRWLDLTNTSFMPSGVNYVVNKEQWPFFSEPTCPAAILEDFLYTFAKYNLTEVDLGPLLDDYDAQFTERFAYHSLSLFGMDPAAVHPKAPRSYACLLAGIEGALHLRKDVVEESLQFAHEQDPLQRLVEGLFQSHGSGTPLPAAVMACFPRGTDERQVRQAFQEVAKAAHAAEYRRKRPNFAAFMVSKRLAALKRLCFLDFFYRDRLFQHIWQARQRITPAFVQRLIDGWLAVADWALLDAPDVLYASPRMRIAYKPAAAAFALSCGAGGMEQVHPSSQALIKALDAMDGEAFVQLGYDFRPGLLRLLRQAGD